MRARHPLFVFAFAAVAIGIASWLLVGRTEAAPEAMALVPADASAIARARTGPLVRSSLLRAIGMDPAVAIEGLREACRVEPTEAVDEITLFGWGGDGLEHIGVIAHTAIEPQTLVDCVGRALDAEGVTAHAIEIDRRRGFATESSFVVQVAPSLFVLGDEPTVRRVLRVADGDEPSIATDPALMRLLHTAAEKEVRGMPVDDLVVVGPVPARIRDRLASYDALLGAWLAAPRIAIAARLRETTTLRSVALSDRAAVDAEALSRGLRLVGRTSSPIGRLLSHAEVTASEDAIEVTLQIAERDLDELLAPEAPAQAIGDVQPDLELRATP